MVEYLNCNECNAPVSTEMSVCEFCGNNFRIYGNSADLLSFAKELDKKFYINSRNDLLEIISSSKFKEEPMIKFRKTKILLIEYMINDGVLDAEEFCEILEIINSIRNISEDYLLEFISYVSVIFPSDNTMLFINDFDKIKNFITQNRLDIGGIMIERLRDQVLISLLGIKFIKEYHFFTNSKNFINDGAFISKRNSLIEKYNKTINSIKI